MAKIEEIISGYNEEEIKQLENGKLEEALNIVLKYKVKEPHLKILERLFDFYWYTPVHDLDIRQIDQKIDFISQLSAAVSRQRERMGDLEKEEPAPAGQQLLEMIGEFAKRFARGGRVSGESIAFELLQEIVDAAKDELTETERTSAYLVINYLRAKRVS